MIVADTSVWVQHFRRGLPDFRRELERGMISMHPVVLGELAVGNLGRREQTLAALRSLPQARTGTADECLYFIEMHGLHGRGIGWNDVQLLVSVRLCKAVLWSLDTRLGAAADGLGVAYRNS